MGVNGFSARGGRNKDSGLSSSESEEVTWTADLDGDTASII